MQLIWPHTGEAFFLSSCRICGSCSADISHECCQVCSLFHSLLANTVKGSINTDKQSLSCSHGYREGCALLTSTDVENFGAIELCDVVVQVHASSCCNHGILVSANFHLVKVGLSQARSHDYWEQFFYF